MANPIIQSTTAGQSFVDNISCFFDDPVKTGNAIFVVVDCIIGLGESEFFTITDNLGSTYEFIIRQTDLDATPMAAYVAFNVQNPTQLPTTVSMSLNLPHEGDDISTNILATEVNGITAVDTFLLNYPVWESPSSTNLASVVTLNAQDLIISTVQSFGSPPPGNIYSEGLGYLMVDQIGTPGGGEFSNDVDNLGAEYTLVERAGNYTPTIFGTQSPEGGAAGVTITVAFYYQPFVPPPPECELTEFPLQGPFLYPNGNPLANGRVSVRLVFDCNCPCADYQIIGNKDSYISLDENGMVLGSPQIRPNSQLSPNGSYYIVQAFSSAGQLVLGPLKLVI